VGWHLRRPWFLPQGRWLPTPVWNQRHRGLTLLLWAHIPGLFAFALIRDFSPGAAAWQCAVLLPAASIAMIPRLSRNMRSASTSLGLVLGASLFVHFAGGSIEAHFQFFVILAFLTLYQAWLPLLVALAYVVAEHGIIGALDPRAVYNNPSDIAHPWKYAAIHGGFVLAASFANILSWRLSEQEAFHDGLTRLPNRVFFLDSLTRSLEGRERMTTAVLYIDLDNFKDANDAFGHDFGDAVLRALSERLQGALRPGDLLARLGGDEFAVALCDLENPSSAKSAAQRILAVLSEPVHVEGITLGPAASVGLAFAGAGDSAAGLLRNADLAMYEAKRGGGSRVALFEPILHAVALRRTELEAELRVALEREQFLVYYQPIFDLATNEVVGTEALVRWRHPTRGILAPGEFIAAAEQSGIIVPLGAWVLRTACRQTAQWQAEQPDRAPLSVSVNLAPRQLADRTIIATVAEALHDAGLEASCLCLEITEGSVIKDFEAALPILNALRTLGVSLALDDFGTGYSSLSYLKQLPVNSVKIDRSFVADLDSNIDNCEIVSAIISLAHTLGLSVTAEGAETKAQLEALQRMGSDHAQGYFLGHPRPARALDRVMARHPQPATSTRELISEMRRS
jgi:diguanylate cyclase (GGDEF)-like protein